MKKLVFMFVAMAAISFASCGNENKGTANDSDSIKGADTTQVTEDTTTTDTTTTDTTTAAPTTEAAAQ